MLTTASQFTPRARSICARHVSTTGSRVIGVSVSVTIRHCEQTRGFRFDNWSTPDDELRKELRRRHRRMRKEFTEDLHRNLSWDHHVLTRHTLKRMMNSYWRSREGNIEGRFCGETEPVQQRSPHNEQSVRPGRNIEDVERGALEHLMYGEDESHVYPNEQLWRKDRRLRRAKDTVDPCQKFSKPIEQEAFVIDPITNRKILRHSSPHDSGVAGVDIPVRTFKDYRSQFIHPDAIANKMPSQDTFDTEPSTEELQKYRQVDPDVRPEGSEADVSIFGSTYSKLGHTKFGADPNQSSTKTQTADSNSNSWDDGVSESVTNLTYDDLHQYKPLQDDVAPGPKEQDVPRDINDLAEYNDLRKYKPAHFQDVFEQSASFDEDNYREYDDLRQHEAALENVQDQFGGLKPPSQDELRAHSYDSSMAEDIAKRLKDFDCDKATKHKSTASRTEPRSDTEPTYDGSARYETPDTMPLDFHEDYVKPEVLRKYQSFIEDLEPKDFPQSTVEELRDKYCEAELKQCTVVRDCHRYEAVNDTSEAHDTRNDGLEKHDRQEWYEPVGKAQPSKDYLTSEYDPEELAKYEPYYWNEPDGQPLSSAEELRGPYSDLDRYCGPVLYNEPDGKPPPSEEELSLEERRIDARQYDGPYEWDEPKGNMEPSDEELMHLESSSDAHRYEDPVWWNEPSSKHETASVLEEEDLRRYIELKDDSVDGQHAQNGFIEELSFDEAQEDSAQREAMKKLMADVKAMEDGGQFKRQDSVDKYMEQLVAKEDRETLEREALDAFYNEDALDREDGSIPVHTAGTVATSLDASYGFSEHAGRLENDRLASTDPKEVDIEDTRGVEPPQKTTKLTGNYSRDFPEEFERSWTETLAAAPTEDIKMAGLASSPTASESMDGGLEGGFEAPEVSKIEPALDRHSNGTSVEYADPYSKEPRGLETSYAEECGALTQPVVVKHYGGKTKAEEGEQGLAQDIGSFTPIEEHSTQCLDEPISDIGNAAVVYKILAYDPTMQRVNVAETTSLVPDFASALSPADALLRLSHPTKFFPFFASLEAEGFEIASGSGDVLVFRKVRPTATPKPEPAEPNTTEDIFTEFAESDAPTEHRINPIDMTGRPRMMPPASANFASPTGYVAYDNLPEMEAKDLPPPPPPRVRYNIDMRREEPVYSGPKYYSGTYDENGRPRPAKKSLGRRLLLGGVWVASISYGLGVVAEFFTTGGVDGVGATGF